MNVLDKSATVSCSENYMRIDLERNVFNISAYSAITLKDSNCKATSSRSYISLGTIPSRCGSKREETYDHIIYKNEVNMIAKPTKGLITRENNMRISFMCSYKKTGNVSFVSFKPLSEVNVTAGGKYRLIFCLPLQFYSDFILYVIVKLLSFL